MTCVCNATSPGCRRRGRRRGARPVLGFGRLLADPIQAHAGPPPRADRHELLQVALGVVGAPLGAHGPVDEPFLDVVADRAPGQIHQGAQLVDGEALVVVRHGDANIDTYTVQNKCRIKCRERSIRPVWQQVVRSVRRRPRRRPVTRSPSARRVGFEDEKGRAGGQSRRLTRARLRSACPSRGGPSVRIRRRASRWRGYPPRRGPSRSGWMPAAMVRDEGCSGRLPAQRVDQHSVHGVEEEDVAGPEEVGVEQPDDQQPSHPAVVAPRLGPLHSVQSTRSGFGRSPAPEDPWLGDQVIGNPGSHVIRARCAGKC